MAVGSRECNRTIFARRKITPRGLQTRFQDRYFFLAASSACKSYTIKINLKLDAKTHHTLAKLGNVNSNFLAKIFHLSEN